MHGLGETAQAVEACVRPKFSTGGDMDMADSAESSGIDTNNNNAAQWDGALGSGPPTRTL
jgi:hypothetical protein